MTHEVLILLVGLFGGILLGREWAAYRLRRGSEQIAKLLKEFGTEFDKMLRDALDGKE